MTDPLLQAVVYLAAAVACVPVAKKLGMGSVLGYLTAGIVIGPFLLGFIGEEGKDIMHFAEFGVVMMLFLVGLELEPEAFWKMRQRVVGLGAAQLLVTALACAAVGIALGLPPATSVAIGSALAMSSTAIALQSLKEKGLMGTGAGQQSFAVLLFQDIAVIPILALLPLLATSAPTSEGHGGSSLSHQPGWVQTLAVAAAVAAVVAAGRFVVVPALRVVARTRLRELFTASALLIVVATALLMQRVGLSPALGTFLAGVVLANSEFKHELESDLDPFKGLLLGLFFMGVGASIDFHLIAEQPGRIALLTIGVVVLKALVLFGLGRRSGLSLDQTLVFSLGLSQVGEFAFVLFAFISQLGLIDPAMSGILMAITALSMTSTPLLVLLHERVLQPRMGGMRAPERAADEIDEKHAVIIAGFSHFGSTVGRFLRANGVEATILDHDSDRVDLLRRMGFKVYFGDATRADLLHSAGAAEARILVSAVDGLAETRAVVETAKKHFPHLRVLVRARHRFDAYEIMDLGVKDVYRDHLDTSIRLGVDVLRLLGHRAHSAHRAGQQFREYDEAGLAALSPLRHDMKNYVSSVRELIALQEQLLASDRQREPGSAEHAWDSEEMRNALK